MTLLPHVTLLPHRVARAQTSPFARAADVRGIDFAVQLVPERVRRVRVLPARPQVYRSSDRWSTRDGIGTIEKGLARSRDRVPNTPRGVLRGSVVRACAIPAKVRCRKHVKWTERRPLPSREQMTCAVLTSLLQLVPERVRRVHVLPPGPAV